MRWSCFFCDEAWNAWAPAERHAQSAAHCWETGHYAGRIVLSLEWSASGG